MNYYFVNRFYFPDQSATSQMLTDLAENLAKKLNVSVVTSRLQMDRKGGLQKRETRNRVRIFRIWSTRFGRNSLWRKGLDLLSFQLALIVFLLRVVQKGDVVILKTDPPLLQLVTTSAVRLKGGKVVNWLQDIYPEIAQRLGHFPAPRWMTSIVQSWRNRVLNAAVANVVVSGFMASYLRNRGVDFIKVIPNWANGDKVFPVQTEQNSLRAEWGLSGKFVVMYSGNFGRVHAFTGIIEAVRQLRGHADIQFVFVGEGAHLERLRRGVSQSGTNHCIFKPYQPQEKLCSSLGVADVHLVSLKPGMEELVTPSKLYGILASGRAVMFLGDTEGEITRLIESEMIGNAVAHDDGSALANKLVELRENPDQVQEYGRRARSLFEREFSDQLGMARWEKLLTGLQGTPA